MSSASSLAHRYRLAAVAAGLAVALSGCSATPGPTGGTASPQAAQPGLPNTHIHGLSASAVGGKLLLATHDGLFDISAGAAAKIGASHDLMGFTAGPDQRTLYASGHPGAGSKLPNPLGLMRSTEGGATWEPLSRQGKSDFHALAVTKKGIIAFDGTLRTSPDGKTWSTLAASFVPAALAGSHGSDTVLATTAEGVQRSADGGATWALNRSAPLLRFAAFAGNSEVVGVEPGGAVHYSSDGGASWATRGTIPGEVYAVDSGTGSDGSIRMWAATSAGLLESADGGVTFRPHSAR